MKDRTSVSRSGIFKPYIERKPDKKNSLSKEIKRELEREELAASSKQAMINQLKIALPELEKRICQAVTQRDLVLFAYNYYRSIVFKYATEDMCLETLEFFCTLPSDVGIWDLPSKKDIMMKYLPIGLNRNDCIGTYTVNDLLGCAVGILQGVRDCSEDFFDNHCKIIPADEDL